MCCCPVVSFPSLLSLLSLRWFFSLEKRFNLAVSAGCAVGRVGRSSRGGEASQVIDLVGDDDEEEEKEEVDEMKKEAEEEKDSPTAVKLSFSSSSSSSNGSQGHSQGGSSSSQGHSQGVCIELSDADLEKEFAKEVRDPNVVILRW